MKYYIKSKLKFLYKKLIINIFNHIYKKPKLGKNNKNNSLGEFKINLDNNNYTIFQFKNGRLFTDSNDTTAYITEKNKLSTASLQYSKFDHINSTNNKISKNKTLFEGTPKIKKYFNGVVLSLLSGGASKDNFTHWFTDVIPRLKIFNKKFKLNQVDKFYVPSLKYQFQIDSLKMLGIHLDKIITSEQFKHITANCIYATSHPCNHFPMKVKKWSLNYLRKSFIKKSNKKWYKKIFVDRDQFKFVDTNNLEKFKDFRVLINEQEIKKYLLSVGFTIIKPEEFSFKEQVEIFSNTNYVVGLYGAAMMMLTFCKKSTKVIEIKPTLGGNEFKNISKLLALKHNQIILKPIIKPSIPQNGLLYCSIKKIRGQLKKLH
jgi:hypothetical protein